MTHSESDVRAATFRVQLATALALLDERGMSKRIAAPPLHRLLWLLGVRLPPPAFCTFALNASLFGAYFGAVWGSFAWLALWSTTSTDPLVAFVAAAIAGLWFGLTMAAHTRWLQRKYLIPTWEVLARPPLPPSQS